MIASILSDKMICPLNKNQNSIVFSSVNKIVCRFLRVEIVFLRIKNPTEF